MFLMAKWMLNVLWCMAGIACTFGGLWLVVISLWRGLWFVADEEERKRQERRRRFVVCTGGLLLCAAAVIFIGLF